MYVWLLTNAYLIGSMANRLLETQKVSDLSNLCYLKNRYRPAELMALNSNRAQLKANAIVVIRFYSFFSR